MNGTSQSLSSSRKALSVDVPIALDIKMEPLIRNDHWKLVFFINHMNLTKISDVNDGRSRTDSGADALVIDLCLTDNADSCPTWVCFNVP